MKEFLIYDEFELVCPICHASGHCPHHLAESWVVGKRPNHAAKTLEAYSGEPLAERLKEQYPTPEYGIEGIIFVHWDDPSVYPPRRVTFLFHPEGRELLPRYRKFLLGQMEKPKQFQRILKLMREHQAPASQSTPTASAPEAPNDPVSQKLR